MSFCTLSSLIICCSIKCFSQDSTIQQHLNSSTEFYNTASPKKAITLVVHGLNVRPAAMLDLVKWLNEQGSDAYLVKLSGHHANSVNAAEITATVWQSEMISAYNLAKKASFDNLVPLFFLGYSLGGLLGPGMMCLGGGIYKFDRQLLFAPAIGIRTRSHLVKLSFFLDERRKLPSYTPKEYRANKGLPIRFYKIMFRQEKMLRKNRFMHVNIPTLVFIDPADELISHRKLSKLSRRFQLTNFRFILLDSDLTDRETKYHHLIINERTMGEKNWKVVTREMSKFLFEN
jgi:esterase/lipase